MPEQPVEVFLTVRLKERGGRSTDQWWSLNVNKREDFDASDFTPFTIVRECEETGYRKCWDFEVEQVHPERRVVVLAPYEIALSKSWPLERALMALGWAMCSAREVVN